jgi:hypothetical protein
VPLRTRFPLVLAAVLALAAAASCTSDQVAAPRPTDPLMLLGLRGTSSALITCRAGKAGTATGLIGPLGGVLAAGNTRVAIPAGAVLSFTTFTLTVPSSRYVEIEVKPTGGEHFVFELPVTVTLDYRRCRRSNLDKGLLTAWNIDPVTKRLLAPMVSVDDKLARTVTFSTVHFSGYAVAD